MCEPFYIAEDVLRGESGGIVTSMSTPGGAYICRVLP